jgi:beta-glucosidase
VRAFPEGFLWGVSTSAYQVEGAVDADVHDHLAAVHDAIEQDVPVAGYCHWSFLDNFEWALGYAQRFGLVHVDYETLARTVKDSGRYYSRIARANALIPPGP